MSDDDTTRIITRKSPIPTSDNTATVPIGGYGSNGSTDDDPHTKIFRPTAANAPLNTAGGSVKADDFSIEPVVGWLVIVKGPGRGQSLKLGYGVNSIGRAPDQRVSLNFGDDEISREKHTLLTYDSKGHKFYIQHGGGTNLTYLGDNPVLQPHELTGRETIQIGNTYLCFIPFCGPEFEWQG
jgi:hypothetical protein